MAHGATRIQSSTLLMSVAINLFLAMTAFLYMAKSSLSSYDLSVFGPSVFGEHAVVALSQPAAEAAPANSLASSPGTSGQSAADRLFEVWSQMYALHDPLSPPASISRPLGWGNAAMPFPYAPHLEHCELVTQARMAADTRAADGSLPLWANPQPPLTEPQPPWVMGSNQANVAHTRQIQTQIWLHQHPPNCSAPGVRFMLVKWWTRRLHGLGSCLHGMNYALMAALRHKRVLVPSPGSFERAMHNECAGALNGSLDCYFLSMTTQECTDRAMELARQQGITTFWGPAREDIRKNATAIKLLDAQLASDVPVVIVEDQLQHWQDEWPPKDMGDPWKTDEETVELLGKVLKIEDGDDRGHTQQQGRMWKYSQVSHYMLRWPSRSLCHWTNQRRHELFGRQVAENVAKGEDGRARILEKMRRNKEATEDKQAEHDVFAQVHLENGSLEDGVWKTLEPYIPRPLVAMHVRQGDKAREMRLFSFAAYMWLAQRLRRHNPGLSNVLLSTEMQSVIEETLEYPDWHFYYTDNKRQAGMERMRDVEEMVGVGDMTKLSFVNLLLAVSCDHFIGAMGSNWSRLIEELRLTGGRLQAGFLTVNAMRC